MSLHVPICAEESLRSAKSLAAARASQILCPGAAGSGVSACVPLLGRVVDALRDVLTAKGLKAKEDITGIPCLLTEP